MEGGDGIKGLTRLGWHTLLRRAVQPGLLTHSVLSMCVCETALRTLKLGFVCATVGCGYIAADIGAAVQ